MSLQYDKPFRSNKIIIITIILKANYNNDNKDSFIYFNFFYHELENFSFQCLYFSYVYNN